jgi:L-asparaginase II
MCKSDLGKCSEKNVEELSYMIQTHQIQTLSKLKMKQVLKRPKTMYLHNGRRSGRTKMFKRWW